MPLKLLLRIYCPKDKTELLLSECVECPEHLGIDYQHHEVACVHGDSPRDLSHPGFAGSNPAGCTAQKAMR